MKIYQDQEQLTLWISGIPNGWKCTRIDDVCDVFFSNVDKHTVQGELSARLCNYIDVYKNEKITHVIDFMEASADEYELEHFQIRKGDVLLTKDSEEPDDIAIASLVDEDLPGVICGYHLALIRAQSRSIKGRFLSWVHKSKPFRAQYEAKAVGITRFGLSQYAFRSARIPLPSTDEQDRISAYLDKQCAAIDKVLESKREQLTVLEDLRKSIIHKAVTKGLDDSVEFVDSDLVWAKKVPKNWTIKRIKDVLDFFNTIRIPLSAEERGLMTERIYDYYGASGIIDHVESYLFDGEYILLAEDGANIMMRNTPLAFIATGKFWVNNHAHILKPRFGNIKYYEYLLESLDYSLYVTGAAQPKLTKENLSKYNIVVPLLEEQVRIVDYLEKEVEKIHNSIINIKNQVETLEKYRDSLIHECVTGKRRITGQDLKGLANV